MKTFCVEIPVNDPKAMKEFQEMMNRVQDETNAYVQRLAVELGVSEACAADVMYLRTRSRHTEALEIKLIQLHKEGKPPMICDFG